MSYVGIAVHRRPSQLVALSQDAEVPSGATPPRSGLPFVLGKTRLGALPVHCWIAVNVVRPGVRERHPERLAAYNRYVAGQPVIATLRAEFTRVICGDPLPAGYADFEGMTAKDFDP